VCSPDQVVPVILLCLELHSQSSSFLLSQFVHGIQLACNLLCVRQLLSQSYLQRSNNSTSIADEQHCSPTGDKCFAQVLGEAECACAAACGCSPEEQ